MDASSTPIHVGGYSLLSILTPTRELHPRTIKKNKKKDGYER
jgi:hypothetical protein